MSTPRRQRTTTRKADPGRASATFTRARGFYMACEQEIEATGVFGPRGLTRRPLFEQWRKLWSAMCALDRRYRSARQALKGGAR